MKRTFILLALLLAAAMAFGSGQTDNPGRTADAEDGRYESWDYDGSNGAYGHHGGYGRRGGHGGRRGHGRRGGYGCEGGYGPGGGYGFNNFEDSDGPRSFDEDDLLTLEGKFSMVEDNYPALVTDAGEILFLTIHGYVDEIPQEGENLTVRAVKTQLSPNHYMVFSAMVDGEELIGKPKWRGRR